MNAIALSQDFEKLVGHSVNAVHMGDGGWHIDFDGEITLIIPSESAVIQYITIQ